MKYFQSTTDASYMYQPTSAAGGEISGGSAEIGNLADVMRHTTIFKASYIVPTHVQYNPRRDEKIGTAGASYL